MNIPKELQLIQEELKVPKNQYNDFSKFNYRSCEDILEKVKPLLKKHDVSLILTDELVNIGDRYYVKATAILTGKDWEVKTTGFAREEDQRKGMDGSQITGSASSYARKYALNGMFLIDDGKDADSLDNRKLGVKRELPKTSVNTTSGKITPAQAKYLKNLGYSGDVDNMSFEEANAKIKFLLGNKQNE